MSSRHRGAPPPLLHVPTLGHRPPSQCARRGAVGHIFIHLYSYSYISVLVLSIGETLCYTRVLSSGCLLADIVNILGETCVLDWMYFLDGFVDGNPMSRLIVSWISDATMYFVSFAHGFVLFCPSGGHVPWPSLTAVIFAFCLRYYVLQLSMRPAHHRCRRCGSLLA